MKKKIQGTYVTDVNIFHQYGFHFELQCPFEIMLEGTVYRGLCVMFLDASNTIKEEEQLDIDHITCENVDNLPSFIQEQIVGDINSLRPKIEEAIFEKEETFSFPYIHSIVFENEQTYKLGENINVSFHLKDQPSFSFYTETLFTKEGVWSMLPSIYSYNEQSIFQGHYRSNADHVLFYDCIFDQLVDFLKTKPAFRVRMASMGDNRFFLSSLYPKFKQRKEEQK